MKLADLAVVSDRVVALSPEDWAMAVLVGHARTVFDRAHQARSQDRSEGRWSVDLMGALGDLTLLRAARECHADAGVLSVYARHLFVDDLKSPLLKEPDLSFVDDETTQPVGVDAKTFDYSLIGRASGKPTQNRWFALNDEKHRELAGRCQWYFCVLTVPFARACHVSRLVPYAEVDAAVAGRPPVGAEPHWWIGRLKSDGGTESRNFGLEAFVARHLSSPPDAERLRKDRWGQDEVTAAISGKAVRSSLCSLVPAITRHIQGVTSYDHPYDHLA